LQLQLLTWRQTIEGHITGGDIEAARFGVWFRPLYGPWLAAPYVAN
jgi:hypothetical protein